MRQLIFPSLGCFLSSSLLRPLLVVIILSIFPASQLHAKRGSLPTSGTPIYYTFKNSNGGGIAEVIVSSSGKISGHRVLVQDKRFKHPLKLAVSPCKRFVAATADQANLNNLALYDLQTNEASIHSLLRTPDAIEPWRGGFVIGANDGVIYLFQPETKKTYRYNLRQNTYPPARKAEYILVDGDDAWITIQKDSRSQKTKGSRVILFDLANWRLKQDLLMARDRPDLELNSLRERGPSPEIVLASAQANTLLLSMDRYGGVCLTDLDAALDGSWINRSNHSTAPDGSFGTSFPDRWVQFEKDGRDYAFIINSGVDGGAALVDLAARKVLQVLDVPPGLENPVWLPSPGVLAAGIPGKVKRSFGNTLEEGRAPMEGLIAFKTTNTPEGLRLQPRTIPLDSVLGRGKAVHGNSKSLAFFPSKKELFVVDVVSGKTTDRTQAMGDVVRLAP